MNKPSGVLVDHNILVLNQGMEEYVHTETINFGGQETTTSFTRLRYKPDNNLKQEFNRFLVKKIGEVVRQEKIRIYTSKELMFEAFSGNYPSNVHFYFPERKYLPPPVERSFYQSISIVDMAKKNNRKSNERLFMFFDVILTVGLKRLSDFEPKGIHPKAEESFHIFCKLCRKINEKHWPDIFHHWSAEVNNLNYFLTNDKKYINVYRNAKVQFNCQPISPLNLALLNSNKSEKWVLKKTDKIINWLQVKNKT